jgi:hypothetical protein
MLTAGNCPACGELQESTAKAEAVGFRVSLNPKLITSLRNPRLLKQAKWLGGYLQVFAWIPPVSFSWAAIRQIWIPGLASIPLILSAQQDLSIRIWNGVSPHVMSTLELRRINEQTDACVLGIWECPLGIWECPHPPCPSYHHLRIKT